MGPVQIPPLQVVSQGVSVAEAEAAGVGSVEVIEEKQEHHEARVGVGALVEQERRVVFEVFAPTHNRNLVGLAFLKHFACKDTMK